MLLGSSVTTCNNCAVYGQSKKTAARLQQESISKVGLRSLRAFQYPGKELYASLLKGALRYTGMSLEGR